MTKVIFDVFGQVDLAKNIAKKTGYQLGKIHFHQFPDEEILARIETSVKNQDIIFITDLSRPNKNIIKLLFAAETAKELGARSIQLISPYLPYMRQDHQFNPGEGISAKYFARLLSAYFDKVITIDPHLHRYTSLDEIYTIPTEVLHATTIIAKWINEHVNNPILIGPDMESEQWVREIATIAKQPFIVAHKDRKNDYEVIVTVPDLELVKGKTPVVVDDIISTASTMENALLALSKTNMNTKPMCIGVHAVFAHDIYQQLLKDSIATYVTCNTIPHPSNAIDISTLLIDSLVNG